VKISLDKNIFIQTFYATVFLYIFSCGGGGGDSGEDPQEIPVITNVQLIRKSAPGDPIDPDPLNNPIEVYVAEELKYRVYYKDQDLDADLLQLNRYYPSTRTDPFIGEHIEIDKQEKPDDTFEPDDYGFFGAFLGTWRLVFRVEDKMGNQSDPFELYVEVKQPPIVPPPDSPNDQCDGAQPIISKAFIFRENSPDTPIQPSYGDVIDVFVNENLLWQLDYTDEDKDVKYLRFNRYYPSHELIPSLSSTFRIHQAEIEESYHHPDPGFFGDFPGEWRLEFQLEDECHHQSNDYTLWVNVVRP
jgi:hypothetical protein